MTSVIGIIVLLGGLIFFHELGHYLVAKFFGIKVEVFSLGFGKKIFSKTVGETQYTLSLIPLGGYVKLMGDDPFKGVPAAEADRAFSTQKLYKRFAVVAAGPMANLLLAYVLFIIVFWAGQPMVANVVGEVQFPSPAWDAGFRPKDKIVSVDGKPITHWTQMEEQLKPRVNEKVEVSVERNGTPLNIPVLLQKVRAKNPYGEDEEVGGIKGIAPYPAASMIGVSNPKSLAYQAGLRTNDQITKIGTRTINVATDINSVLSELWKAGEPVAFTYKRKSDPEAKDGPEQATTITLPKLNAEPAAPFAHAGVLGIYPVELFVRQVTKDSPAEKGGLLAGDRIVKIGNESMFHFERVVDTVQELGNRNESVVLTVEREGTQKLLDIKPMQTSMEDPLTRQTIKKYMIGFAPTIVVQEAELMKFQIRDPFKLVVHAVNETNQLAKRMVISLWKLAFGSISVKNLGGPILIASVAGKSLDAGIIPFLQMMALISINLFMLNLFPIPILDGGHLLFFAIEGLKGKPVSMRTMELANQVGMAFILMLVAVTLFNDITRLIQH